MKPRVFDVDGSPLKGRVIPRDWFDLDFRGKRFALVKFGLAMDLSEAASILGKHSAAVRRARKAGKLGRRL